MPNVQLPDAFQQWGTLVLIWVGFGTVVGLLAKAIMPGRDPGGAVATVAMGIAGAVIGCGVLAYFYEGARVKPISVIGFAVATAGAFILLFFYRLLAGYFFVEGNAAPRGGMMRRYTRRRSRAYTSDRIDD